MAAVVQQNRKILVLRDEPSVRNLLTLIEKLESENALDGDGRPVPTATARKHFDRAILDVRYPKGRSREEVHGIRELRPALVGTQLVVTAEINGAKTLKLIERYLFNRLPQTLLWLIKHRYRSR